MFPRFFVLSSLLIGIRFSYGVEPTAGLAKSVPEESEKKHKGYTFMLTGASFADPRNGWFELVCAQYGIEAINKAKGGTTITHTAGAMYTDTFYTPEELRKTDALIIMHVYNVNVANTEKLKDNFKDYTLREISHKAYARAYDYVIKKYMDDCRKLKDDPASEYYGSADGKPAVIILCTHWHDSRTIYNDAIRNVAAKFNLPLVKWDENIGFTKNTPDADGKQPSLRYSKDKEKIGDVTYGWHPNRGKNQLIQKKLAEIFSSEIKRIFDVQPVLAREQE